MQVDVQQWDVMIDGKTNIGLGLGFAKGKMWPGAPSTRDYTVTVPGHAGIYDFGADMGVMPLSLPFVTLEKDAATLQKVIRGLTQTLYDSDGRPKTIEVRFRETPEQWYMARYTGSLPISRIVQSTLGRFSLPMTAYDPHAYAESTAYDPNPIKQYDAGNQYDSGLMYANPTSFGWTYSRQYVGLYNYAYLKTPVRIIIQGSVINPRITNQTTGEKTTVSITTGPNDLLVIDSEKYYVVKSTSDYEQYFLSTTFPADFMAATASENFIFDKVGDFVTLAPGENSLLFEGGLPSASVQIVWNHRYL